MREAAFANHLSEHRATYDGDILACNQILVLQHRSDRLVVLVTAERRSQLSEMTSRLASADY
jgi:hypothetical protein